MAVYKIYPKKDTTIFTSNPLLNTSLNEILYIQEGQNNIARSLIQFDTNDINNILSIISGSNYSCSLKLFSAETYGLYNDTTIEVLLLGEQFGQGNGKLNDIPVNTNPPNWSYPFTTSIGWVTASMDITSSFNDIVGGGNWYINNSSSQTISYDQTPDLDINITALLSQSLSLGVNYGYILKLKDDNINYTSPALKSLSYFGKDTSTIYSPYIEFKWNDSIQSSSYSQITTSNISIFADCQSEYFVDEIVDINIYTSLRYPIKVYQTSSVYLDYHLLPSQSCYGIKDIETNIMVVDFDFNNTKLSSLNEKNYFTLYMNGLEPERYYEILIKYKLNNKEYISQNKNYFKVINKTL